jgi:hypothetical protein
VSLKNQVRARAEKRVTREFIALLYRFKEEGIVAGVDFVESGNRRFHVGDDLAVNRDQIAAMGQFAKTFARGKKTGVHKSGRSRAMEKPTDLDGINKAAELTGVT